LLTIKGDKLTSTSSVWRSNLSYLYRIIKIDASRTKMARFNGRDLDKVEDNFLDMADRDVIVPWPPRISTQPPSPVLWRTWPEVRGSWAVAWALIGVVNASSVKKAFRRGSLDKLDDFLGAADSSVPAMIPLSPAIRA
jgi:hypothetical protein